MGPVLLAQAVDGSSFTGESHARFDAKFIPEEMVPVYFSAALAILISYTESVGASGPIHSYAGYGVPIVAADVGYHLRESMGGHITAAENLYKAGHLLDE